MTIMEMFDLTKNHKGDILISRAASKYSGSWTVSETQGAAESAELPGPCDMAEELPASLPRPQAQSRAGQRAACFAEYGKQPWESEQPLFPAGNLREECFPMPPGGENSGSRLINHTKTSVKWLCSFALTIVSDNRNTALASLG